MIGANSSESTAIVVLFLFMIRTDMFSKYQAFLILIFCIFTEVMLDA